MHELWHQVSWLQITGLLTNKVTGGRSMPPCTSSYVYHHHYYYCEGVLYVSVQRKHWIDNQNTVIINVMKI